MNRIQRRLFFSGARDQRVLAGRRFGKTDGVIGPRIYRVAESMPQATNGWIGSSRAQLYARTVPGTIAAIERFYGLVEGVHFGWGRPPKGVPLSIIRPKTYDNIVWFANGSIYALISLAVIGSANSYTFNHIIGDEMKFCSKSKIDGEVMPALSGITHPLGDSRFSELNPLYKGTLFCSDASLTSKGNWLEKEEEKLDLTIESGEFEGKTYRELQEELFRYADKVSRYNDILYRAKKTGRRVVVVTDEEKRTVQELAARIMRREGVFKPIPKQYQLHHKALLDWLLNYKLCDAAIAELIPDAEFMITKEEHFEIMMLRQSKKYAEHLRKLRCNAFTFVRASTLDNIDILGYDYIARMKRDLPALVFMTSILNKKIKKFSTGFYSNLDIENVHGYIPDDCPAINQSFRKRTAQGVIDKNVVKNEFESPDFAELANKNDCTLDDDVVDSLPIHISMDYNANINWVVVGQVYRRDGVETLNVINSIYVKNERKLRGLMEDFNKYYLPHKSKNNTVYYYYDNTSKFRGYAIEGMEDFKDTVINELSRYGWDVIGIDMGAAMAHEMKYKDINESLAGVAYPAIRINRINNQELIIAMEATGVSMGYKGFRKDKSGEKLSEDAQKDDVVMLEYRTDGTDAFDNLFLGVKYHQNSLAGMCLPRGGR